MAASAASLVREGQGLIRAFRCTVCHAIPSELESRVGARRASALDGYGARRRLHEAEAFLAAGGHLDALDEFLGVPLPLPVEERAKAIEELAELLGISGFRIPSDGRVTPDLRQTLELGELERGRALFHSVGCVACHPPFEPAWALEDSWADGAVEIAKVGPVVETLAEDVYVAPGTPEPPRVPLDDLLRWRSKKSLAEFLLEPLILWPDGRMPGFALSYREASDLAAYLLAQERLREGGELERAPGLVLEYFEASFDEDDPDFDALETRGVYVARTLAEPAEHRKDQFGFRFRGLIEIPANGAWWFFTASDDGSFLAIDGERVVSNGGVHATAEEQGEVVLEAGSHAIEVTWFEANGGDELVVQWEGPGVAKAEIPGQALSHALVVLPSVMSDTFVPDPAKALRGGARFVELGCAACHSHGELDEIPAHLAGPPLLELSDAARGGCLDVDPRAGIPRLELDEGERARIRGVLANGAAALRSPLPMKDALALTLERLNCYACHRRDDFGGPHPLRFPYFRVNKNVELGDEGRIPPHLDFVGVKLREQALADVLLDGARVRPYMQTRMPLFGEENVAALAGMFRTLDVYERDPEPPFDPSLVEAGRTLVGTKGLGCIQCHTFDGIESLGVPAVDLASVSQRIRPGWFRHLLLDPDSVEMNSRMPAFWTDGRSPVKDLFDGDPERQVAAIWTYLTLGASMPIPEGLAVPEGEYELVPVDRPILCGVFMEGLSPRTVVVGFPERIHVAFDVEHSRLAKVWRGRFFDARGTWHGRAGELERPPSDDWIDLPAGPPLAYLESAAAPWPSAMGRAAGYRVLGTRFETDRRPIFRYAFDDVVVEERFDPLYAVDGLHLLRTLELSASREVEGLFFRASEFEVRELKAPVLLIDGKELDAREPASSGLFLDVEYRYPVILTQDTDGRYRARVVQEIAW